MNSRVIKDKFCFNSSRYIVATSTSRARNSSSKSSLKGLRLFTQRKDNG